MSGRNKWIIALALGLGVSACQTVPKMPASAADPVPDTDTWRATATDQDKERIRNWHKSWQAALADARAKGNGADVDREGLLLQPMAALANPRIPAGDYRCRTVKIGAKGRSSLGYVGYGWFRCRITPEQGGLTLTKTSGSQRPVGRIFPDAPTREIFLGTLVLGDERMAIDYGSDRMRDMAGLVERIGTNRWRLVLPAPAYESLLDVIELVPAN
ncbi:MAG: DUF4893 domain-containing protein [Sphingopyxis sp.]|nr:DUF4893 domain-containing protein [Sphingopyxis sp.]